MSKLSAYLEARSETVVSFAARVSVAPSTIYRLIKGDTNCTADLARKIMVETAGAVTPNDLILPDAQPNVPAATSLAPEPEEGCTTILCAECERPATDETVRGCQFRDCPRAGRWAA